MTTEETPPDLPTAPLPEKVEPEWFHHHHELHHKAKVKAFELWEATVTSGGVDYGPWFYWFSALFEMGIIHSQPLPPPVE